MIVRVSYQVLIAVRGWCRLTSEKASPFQKTGRGGSSQREGRSSEYQPSVPGNVLGTGLQPCIHVKSIYCPDMLDTSMHGRTSETENKPGQNNRSLAKFGWLGYTATCREDKLVKESDPRLLEQLKQINGLTWSETKIFGLNTMDAFNCKTQDLIKRVFASHNDLQTR